MNEIILKMVDGGIIDITHSQYSYPGCETCDFGSRYIDDVCFQMTQGDIFINSENMYSHALCEGDFMRIILKNHLAITAMTEKEFANWLEENLIGMTGKLKVTVELA